jgi:hypothetical protein
MWHIGRFSNKCNFVQTGVAISQEIIVDLIIIYRRLEFCGDWTDGVVVYGQEPLGVHRVRGGQTHFCEYLVAQKLPWEGRVVKITT